MVIPLTIDEQAGLVCVRCAICDKVLLVGVQTPTFSALVSEVRTKHENDIWLNRVITWSLRYHCHYLLVLLVLLVWLVFSFLNIITLGSQKLRFRRFWTRVFHSI